ncbi:COX15/CtaA family protein [Jatrophihabitans sp. DSM 45814]
MGVAAALERGPATKLSRLRGRLRATLTLRRLALTSIVVNVIIVVTGGAVRLTQSGLGCPTFPSCGDGSLIPTRRFGVNGVIEFTNRQLTFVVVAVVLATLIVAVLDHREIRLAVLLAASIPAQALLGGLTVLTHLNPWLVACHFLLSMAIIAIAHTLWWRVSERSSESVTHAMRHAALAVTALTVAVLALGTVVTGSGPHAGDADSSGKVHRTGLDVGSMSQLHADVVMLLIGVTVGFVLLARSAGAPASLRRAAAILLGVELAQGLIGFVQYFTHIPAILVGFHMLGACLVWLAALRVLSLTSRTSSVGSSNEDGPIGQQSMHASQSTPAGAVGRSDAKPPLSV